uniref:CARMIL_C domain-containing protein n=1 Tax=Angiostrongylus cantonensis TaxID=6313 RepID=A0A0K0D295_ANGCA
MERLGRVWTRLSVSRPNLPLDPRNEADVDEDLPGTKNEVFEMFSHSSASNHRKSDVGLMANRIRTSIDGTCSQKSSSPQRRQKKHSTSHVGRSSTIKATMPKFLRDEETQGQPGSKTLIVPNKLVTNPSSTGGKRSASFHEESCSFGVQSPTSRSSTSQEINTSAQGEGQNSISIFVCLILNL